MSGSRRFLGARLKEAREARELTAVALSDLAGVSKQAISKFENDLLVPSAEAQQRLSNALNVPMHFFYRPIEAHEEPFILKWRSTSTASKKARVRAERRFGWLRRITRYLSNYADFPPINFPEFDVPTDPTQITEGLIESAATKTRQFWGLEDGAISNVCWLLENKGAIVSRHEFSAPKIDAFSEWHPARHPYVVLSTDKDSAARSRFDACHELGHLLLHRRVTQKQFNTASIHSQVERQADFFASCFLLPESRFMESFYSTTLDSLVTLKSEWGVSIAAIIRRASHLRMISEKHEQRLWINFSRKGWRRREPLDDKLEHEQPRNLRRAIEQAVEHGLMAPNDLPFQLGLNAKDVEELTGLPDGYLSSAAMDVCMMAKGKRHATGAEPQIIKFPKAN